MPNEDEIPVGARRTLPHLVAFCAFGVKMTPECHTASTLALRCFALSSQLRGPLWQERFPTGFQGCLKLLQGQVN